MKTFAKHFMISTALIAVSLTSAKAQGLTVPPAPPGVQETYDATAIEQIMNVVDYSKQMVAALSEMVAAVIESKDITKAALMGDKKDIPMFDTGEALDERAGALGLTAIAEGTKTGGGAGSAGLTKAISDFVALYNLDAALKPADATDLDAVAISKLVAASVASAAVAEAGYQRSNTSMARLDTYIKAIAASPDLKTSMDLNTRVLVEIAQQNNELLRSQAALTSIAGHYFMLNGRVEPETP